VTASSDAGEPAGAGRDRPYEGGLGTRREARERAVALLYEAEVKDLTPAQVIDALPVAPDPFTEELVRGTGEHLDELDPVLRDHARGWTLERMPALDRAVLRLGAYELTYRPEIPVGAVISEAVELAKQYSTDDSGKFVNGMLSAIAASVRPG
jgi:N utilization substance protein B